MIIYMTDNKGISGFIVVTSFVWKFMERANTQIINLIVQVFLARMIAPEEFGSLAVLSVFFNIATIFVQKGLSSSLIRKKQADDLDYDTAFIVSIFIAIVLYIVLFVAAPYIATIFNSSELKNALRVLTLNLLFGALYCIQNAILVRQMKFKIIFFRGLISSIISGGIGITMAIHGFGLWALVAQIVSNQIILCLIVMNSIEWKPHFRFSFERLSEIVSFGGKILISELLVYIIEGIRTLIVGKKFTTELLSYYDRGQSYPATIMRSIYDTIGSVLLPIYSKKQDEPELLATAMYQAISICMFLITPFFVGLAAVAKPLISVLLTEKWLPCVPFFIVFCFYQITYPIQGITRQVLYARGNSELVLKMEVIKGIITMIALVISLKISVFAIAVSALITTYFITGFNLFYTKKVIPIQIKKVFINIKNTLIYNVGMFLIIFAINFVPLENGIKLLIQIFLGIITYITFAIIFKDKNYKTCLKLLSVILNKKFN